MPRMLFTKTGTAVWISHLDLMRALQRGFRRAGLRLKHSQGYSPHPALSIALPLSVGVASDCELADFELDESESVTMDELPARLNAALPRGIRVLRCYEDGLKLKHLKWLKAVLTLEYDNGVPAAAPDALQALFFRESLPVEKHGKNGVSTVDLIPMLHAFTVEAKGSTIDLAATVSAQNPTLNPLLLGTAIEAFLPECKPDFIRCRRTALYDESLQPFD